ncbi:hypothetical protein [Chondromyces crocatus]|uniref:Uncharacterized protein n=1 Tax=Chondromyces crocatus TaxID=52 RepID=A0A0K1E986_CHOCO|nr:hypothetical protein [Chondromyces crocatus]AKT37446.1 uncharacterized protein CMC5_015870 [Chondromyces crocatus]
MKKEASGLVEFGSFRRASDLAHALMGNAEIALATFVQLTLTSPQSRHRMPEPDGFRGFAPQEGAHHCGSLATTTDSDHGVAPRSKLEQELFREGEGP